MPGDKQRVLVVDDESSVVLLCNYVLGDAGYEVESATRAEDAIELIQSRQYDAYLIDLVMPGGGGLQVIRAARETSQATPLVVMTAEPEHLVPPRAGMDYYLHKPFAGLQALENTVANAIAQGSRAKVA
ncbi:MAG TPA: response regulator [Myxococcus sp.]|nr:response regulator [Myxococcus sp.]